MTTAAALNPLPASAGIDLLLKPEKKLRFYCIHTRECLDVCYCRNGVYEADALRRINYILRDHRTGGIMTIDTDLLDLLHDISLKTRSKSPFHVISGYRSAATNARLRRTGRGVAAKSLHIKGKAIDVRIPGVPTQRLRNESIKMRGGGVGYYRKPDFVHIDVGRIRYW
jgi:uncharacterized protein YcbK (DUF882 family)